MCGRLPELKNAMTTYGSNFDAGALSLERAAQVVSLCSAIESSISAIKALAATRLAEGETWKREGFRSASQQLAAASGVSTGAAKATLETGRRLAAHPSVARAALDGELSGSQAGLVAAGAEADPDKTSWLLERARTCSISELQDEVARIKAAADDLEDRHKKIHEGRRVRTWSDLEGVWHLAAQGVVENGAKINQVIATIRRALITSRRRRGVSGETFEALDYDSIMALIHIALGTDSELSLADLHRQGLFPGLEDLADLLEDLDNRGDDTHEDDTLGDDSPRDDASSPVRPPPADSGPSLFDDSGAADSDSSQPVNRPPKDTKAKAKRPRRGALTTQIQIRVDLDTLLRGVPIEGELCEIVGYGPIPVSVIDALLAHDNVFVVAALTKAEDLIGVYHWGRHPTAYQKSALSFLYPTCAAQGCNSKAFLQNDHREDWAKTHYTAYDLMDRLCSFHHGLKTNQNWALVEGKGKRRFVAPHDPDHPRNRGPTDPTVDAA